jgi:multidrug efflux system outer membrane protein
MKLKNIILFPIILSAILYGGCKVSQKSTEPALSEMPQQYPSVSDTSQSPPVLSWREFFKDAYLAKHIDEALKNNLDLKMAIQRVEMARSQVRLSKGALWPSLIAGAGVSQRKFGEYTMDGVGNYDTNLSPNVVGDKKIPDPYHELNIGLFSSWEIDVWGRIRNHKKASMSRFLSSESGQQLVTTLLVAEVSQRYYRLLALDDKLKIIRENIRLQETAVNLITALKAGGRATELAVKQFTAQLLNTRSLESLVKQDIVQQENELNLILGRYPQSIERGTSLLHHDLLVELQAGLPSQLLTQRPDIRQAELELKATRFDVKSARAAMLPSITIHAGAGVESFNPQVIFNPASLAYSVLGGLTAPLFNRNLLSSELQAASARQKESFYNYQKTIINSYQEVVTLINKISNFQDAYQSKEEEVRTLHEGVATSNDLFVAGFASYLEVVTAQKGVISAQLEAVDIRQMQFDASINLYRALGGGWQ